MTSLQRSHSKMVLHGFGKAESQVQFLLGAPFKIFDCVKDTRSGCDEIGRLPVLRSPGSKERAGSSPVTRTKPILLDMVKQRLRYHGLTVA